MSHPRAHEYLDDAALLERARSGDGHAAEEIFARHRPKLARFIRAKSRTAEDAEDLLQEARIAVYRGAPSYRGDGAASAWIWGIARTLVNSYYSRQLCRQARLVTLEALKAEHAGPAGDRTTDTTSTGVIANHAVEEILRALVSACSETEATIVRMHYEGDRFTEISERLELREATVRSHYLRGRKKLLAHFVLTAPELLGGEENVQAAWRAVCDSPQESERPTAEERHAFEYRKMGTEPFFRAVLKLARVLTLTCFVVSLFTGLGK